MEANSVKLIPIMSTESLKATKQNNYATLDDFDSSMARPLMSVTERKEAQEEDFRKHRSPRRTCGGIHGSSSEKSKEMLAKNQKARKQLILASCLCCFFMVAEFIGGLIANSLAVMTDAAHLLSDLAGFLISIFALWLANRAPTSRLSYGFYRAEILGALISVLLIWVLTAVLIYEAIERIRDPPDVDGKVMFTVAIVGLLVNIIMGVILHQSGHGHSHGLGDHSHSHSHGSGSHDDDDHDLESQSSHSHKQHEDINVRAAFIHVLGDAIQSLGVALAAALIWHNPDWRIADPITTFLFSILVLFTTTRLIRQSVGVLMEGVPEGIDPALVEQKLHSLDGVLEVHDLHIWSLSVGKPALSVHLLTTDDATQVLKQANEVLVAAFNIHHSTIQVETLKDQIDCNMHHVSVSSGIEETHSINHSHSHSHSHGSSGHSHSH